MEDFQFSPGINKGKHQTPLFPTALCSQSIFSPVDDLFYVSIRFTLIHSSNEDPKEILALLYLACHLLAMPILHVIPGIEVWCYYLIIRVL